MFESCTTDWDDELPTDPLGDHWADRPLSARDGEHGLSDHEMVEPEEADRSARARGSRGAFGPTDTSWEQHRIAYLEELLQGEPGGVLAAAVEDARDLEVGRVADLSHDGVLSLATAAQRLLGWAMGAQLSAVGELTRRADGSELAERAVVAEIALACGVSEYAAAQRVEAALHLPSRLPLVHAALVEGRLEWAKAYRILDRSFVLSDEHTAAIEPEALRVALTENTPALDAHLNRAIIEIDPDGAERRARDAHARRGVTFRANGDSTATMALTASAATIASAEAGLNLLTDAAMAAANGVPSSWDGQDGDPFGNRARRGSDDGRHVSVTRADVLSDLIENAAAHLLSTTSDDDSHGEATRPESAGPESGGLGATARRRGGQRALRRKARLAKRVQVRMTMALSTMLGLDERTADLSGYGAIPAAMAREVAASGTWRCAVTDDRSGHVHGTVLGLGRGTFTPDYTPTAAAWEFVVERDGMCVFPGCRRQSARCDLDHQVPWPDGDTCDCNLEPLCGNHHRLKHESGFTVTRDASGVWTWVTPLRRTYERGPTVVPYGRVTPDPTTVDAGGDADATAGQDPPPF